MTNQDKQKANNVFPRLHSAVESLCVGKGDVRQRLVDAGVTLIALRIEDFPAGLQETVQKLHARLTRYPGRNNMEGSFEATAARTKRETGRATAKMIWDLFHEVQRMRGHDVW